MCGAVLLPAWRGGSEAMPVQAWRGPGGWRRLRLPEFVEN